MAQVYRIYNKVTNQSYIGITKNSFRIRYNYKDNWWEETHNSYLKNSVIEYGSDNFIVEILEEGDNLDLENLEISYIKQYNSLYPNGFNMTTGGNYRYEHSKISLLKLSESQKRRLKNKPVWNKGKKLSKEHIDRAKETKRLLRESGELIPWNKGIKTGRPKQEAINNSAKAHKKKIGQYDLNDNLIRVYEGLVDTENEGFNSSQVCLCCKGKAKTHRGYKFKYL